MTATSLTIIILYTRLQTVKFEHAVDWCCLLCCIIIVLIYAALSEAVRDKEMALEELKSKLTSQHDDERWKLSETHLAEISKLNALLMDKNAELDLANEELKRLKSTVAKSEQGLGSATGQVQELRSQVGQLQGELSGAQRQLEGSKQEISQLKVRVHRALPPFQCYSSFFSSYHVERLEVVYDNTDEKYTYMYFIRSHRLQY